MQTIYLQEPTPNLALEIQQQLRALLLKGGFDFHKWQGSSPYVLENIDPTLHKKVPTKDLTKDLTDNHSSQHPKALGMVWDSHADTMSISLGTTEEVTPTKHGVISDIAQTFDVLDWLAPSLVLMKIIFQRLWELKLSWDEEIPADFQDHHQQWKQHNSSSCSRKSHSPVTTSVAVSLLSYIASLMPRRTCMRLSSMSKRRTPMAHPQCLW